MGIGRFEEHFGSASLSRTDIIGGVCYNIWELDVKDQSDKLTLWDFSALLGLQIEVNL